MTFQLPTSKLFIKLIAHLKYIMAETMPAEKQRAPATSPSEGRCHPDCVKKLYAINVLNKSHNTISAPQKKSVVTTLQ